MYTSIDGPAQIFRRRCHILRVILTASLIFMLVSVPARPATAGPIPAPRPDLDLDNRITIPTGVSDGAFLWGDYDNDGDFDFLVSGAQVNNTGKTSIFVNNGGSFSERSSGMEAVQYSSADWGDYDNDGYLDVLLTGHLRVEGGSNVIGFAGLYHNIASGSGRSFSLQQQFDNIYQGSGTFGDYNTDGLLDILLTGYTNGGVPYSKIWKNTGNFSGSGVFSATGTPAITPLGASASAWADYNRDGFMDFAISGKTGDDVPTTILYRNNGSANFSSISLTGVWGGTLNFLDFNLDRYLDLLVTGNTGTNVSPDIRPKTILYQYYTGSPNIREAATPPGLPDMWSSTVSVGDYDNDGYPDIAMGGKTLTSLPNQVYRNNQNGTFSFVDAGLPNNAGTMLGWGDYNGDNSLDLALSGVIIYDPGTGDESYFATYIYPNNLTQANTPPTAPTMEAACWNDSTSRLTMVWKNATDTAGSASSLTYNVRVGTAQNGQDIISPSSNLGTGDYRLATIGRYRGTVPGSLSNLRTLPSGTSRYTAILRSPAIRDYYWSVQAVDSSFVGGLFDTSTGRVINLGTPIAENDTFTVLDSDTNVRLDLLSEDNGGGSPLALYSFTNPSKGQLARDPANPNILIYNPKTPYEGIDSFSYYAIRTDSLYCTRATVTITVNQENDQPTDITLSNNLVPENAAPGTLVGLLSTTDPDMPGQTFTYTLPAGAPDNDAFKIVGNQLLTDKLLNYKPSRLYSIRVRSTDQGGLWFEKDFTIQVVDNQAPTDMEISETDVMERRPIGTVVGNLSSTDPNANDTSFTYSLVPYQGNEYDNQSFQIAAGASTSQLVTNTVFDFNARNIYQVRIRTTDRGGLWYEEVFTINILPSTPVLSAASPLPVIMSEDGIDSYDHPDVFNLTLKATDPGEGEVLTWKISRQPFHGTAGLAEGTTGSTGEKAVTYTPEANWNSADNRGNDSFLVQVTDLGGHSAEITVPVTVKAVNDPPQFDPVANQEFFERSGNHSISITGVKAGLLFESTQKVTLAAQCPVGQPCAPLTNFTTTPVAADGTATLSFAVGAGTGTFTVVLVARDDQTLKNTYSSPFTVTVTPGNLYYLPFVAR